MSKPAVGPVIRWGHWHPRLPFRRTPGPLERLAAFIDGTLGGVEHRRLSEHIRSCESCLRVLHEARALMAGEDATRQV